jgi:D-serine deaminase-like pyridoxal phosphate-dependent protein
MTEPWCRIADEDAVASPALLVFPERIDENLRRMVAIAGGPERLRPHVKTHKMPQVVRLAMEQGVRAFKASTVAEAEMAAAAGAADVLLAYPAVGPTPARLAALSRAFPATTFRAIADCPEGVGRLAVAARAAGTTLDVLVDLNVGMDRTGIAPGPTAGALYRTIAKTPGLSPGGLHAYDGHLHDTDATRLEAAVEAAFAPVWRLRDELLAAGLPVPRMVASGTPTFRILARRPELELGAGTPLLWDAGQPLICPDLDFLHAAVLLTRVVSRPAADRLCLDVGHKAVASEMPHPRLVLLGLEDAEFVGHNEEHLVIRTPRAADYPVGTVVYAIPRHVCPTVNLHAEALPVVAGRVVDRWPVVARTRRITA